MKKVLLVSLVALGFMLSSAPQVYACQKGGSDCAKCEASAQKCKVTKLKKEMKMYWAAKSSLGLSDEQLKKIADIKHAAMKKLIRESAEVKVIKVDVKTAMYKDQIDTAQVNKLIDQKYAAKAKVSKTYVKALADAQKVLTDKQRTAMKEMKTQEYLGKCSKGSSCSKCASSSGGKVCPITGKSLESKGSKK